MEEKISRPNNKSVQTIKLVCVLIVFPILIGFIRGLIAETFKLDSLFVKSLYWGITSYLLFHIFIFEPVRFYKKTQRFIRVILGFFSPVFRFSYYLIPFWVIIIIASYLLFVTFLKLENLRFIFFFLSGFAFAMHIVMVSKILKVDELRKIVDYLFIIFIVVIINIFLFALTLKLYAHSFSVSYVGKKGIALGVALARAIFNQIFVPSVH